MSATATPPKPDSRSKGNEFLDEAAGRNFLAALLAPLRIPAVEHRIDRAHVLALLGVIYLTTRLMKKDEVPLVPVHSVKMKIGAGLPGGNVGGPGGGSEGAKLEAQDDQPQEKPRDTPEVELQKKVQVSSLLPDLKYDPTALQKVAQSPNLQALAGLNEESRKRIAEKLAGKNGSDGSGNGKGDGSNGSGTGPGDATTSGSRSMRWTIIFKTNSGQDYLKQLSVFKAKLLIPEPPDFKSNRFFDDISQPNEGKPLKGQQLPGMEFTDGDATSASKIARALGLNYDPPNFTAFFPKEVEDELAAKERSYRNRREDQIFSTTFRVIERNGTYVITVTDQQTAKR